MFKEIVKEDLENMVDIYVKAFNNEPWNDEWTLDTATIRLKNMMDDSGFYGIKILKDNKIKGFILGHEEQYYNGIIFNIKEFCVSKTVQGQNMGSRLINEMEYRLKNKGIKEIILMTTRDDRAEGFYLRRGYKSSANLIIMGKNI